MEILGIAWLGSRTGEYARMRDFAANVLGLGVAMEQQNAVVFGLPNGDAFEVFKPSDEEHSHFAHPVAGFLVADVDAARKEMEDKGVEFVGEIHRGVAGENWGTAWTHFYAPDGNLYCLVSRPENHPGGQRRAFRELRICLRVSDLDAAMAMYDKGLGLKAVDVWEHPGGQRGALLAVCPAAIELFSDEQWEFVDDHEVGRRYGHGFALRVEVDDAEKSARALTDAGARQLGPQAHVPWGQDVVRVAMHDEVHLSVSVLDEQEQAERHAQRSLLPG
ncbi:MAG TPA: VOC family protein [Eoetvoesiella sp.]|uniref:VOC family protein n=1 Tax=Eoetvoesiella sp. TaxID=1966355 RepID=UPI002B8EFD84|nr:VOC family protein [Eoetvoesiella sp.]HWK60629.1 VOC family protein [Eoetvoesiella sp.]